MFITVTQSGGYAGLSSHQVASVDTAQLPAADGQRLEGLVRSCGFFQLPAEVSGGGVGADLSRYEVTVREGGREHRVAFTYDGTPATERLFQLVQAAAQQTA